MSLKNAIGGIGLIAGTSIGAAVLALPAATAQLGFLPTIGIYLVCWLFMSVSAIYILEANLLLGYGSNLLSMANRTLGKKGEIFTSIIYLMLFYSLTAAYLSGAGGWLVELISQNELSLIWGACITAGIVSCLLWLGTKIIDWSNRLLMLVLIGAFGGLIFLTFPEINPDFLQGQSLHFSAKQLDFSATPLIITAFGFSVIVPTLANYLHGNASQLRKVIIIGSFAPLLIYIVWLAVTMGAIPLTGEDSLLAIKNADNPQILLPKILAKISQAPQINLFANWFSISALLTSLLGISISLFDFLQDGLKLSQNNANKILIALITFVPPLVFIKFFPSAFTFALSFGGIFVAILLGILPTIMVWRARYTLKIEPLQKAFFGKKLAILNIGFFCFVIFIELQDIIARFL